MNPDQTTSRITKDVDELQDDVKRNSKLLSQLSTAFETTLELNHTIVDDQKVMGKSLIEIETRLGINNNQIESIEKILRNGSGLVTKSALQDARIARIEKALEKAAAEGFSEKVNNKSNFYQILGNIISAVIGGGVALVLFLLGGG